MTTSTPSPYNTARSMKASPRTNVNPPNVPVTALPSIKHVISKSGGDVSNASPAPSSRQLPRPSSTGGASVSSARSNTSNLSARMKASPYAIPLSSRSNAEKAKVTPRPDATMSARGSSRVVEANHSSNDNPPRRAPPSPIDVSHDSDAMGHSKSRPSEPSIDALLLREGLDPSLLASSSDNKNGDGHCDQADYEGPSMIDDDPHAEDLDEATRVEPTPTPKHAPCTVHSQEEGHLSAELGESINKGSENVPIPTDQSRYSPDPSPIPVVSNLNLSQYSCAFADTIKGYCSDISSDGSRPDEVVQPEQQVSSLDARYSVDVQVTSRLHETSQEADGLQYDENRHVDRSHRKNLFMRILCCGCMQQK